MIGVANVSGVISDMDKAVIPILDRGFLYGDSLYEVVLTKNKKPVFMADHMDRMRLSAEMMDMKITQSEAFLTQEIERTVAAHPKVESEFYIRWFITRGGGPIDMVVSEEEPTTYIIIVKPIPRKSERYEHDRDGLRLKITSIRRNSERATNPAIKSGNYLNSVLALNEAKNDGYDDCLMITESDNVAEMSRANIWFVINGVVVTPKGNCLSGITRKNLHKAIDSNADMTLEHEERDIKAAEIKNATEAFMTSTTRDVWPIKEIKLEDGSTKQFPEFGGHLTKTLQQLFESYLLQQVL